MEFSKAPNLTSLLRYLASLPEYFHRLKIALSCCDLCQQTPHEHTLLCRYCEEDLPLFKYEDVSFDLLHWPAIHQLLDKCTFDHLFCLAPYIWPFDIWINQLKYHQRLELIALLSALLQKQWLRYKHHPTTNNLTGEEEPVIAAVPLHIDKWQSRGFNQAHLLAKAFAKAINHDYCPNLLSRIKATESQVGKSGKARRKNLSGAFALNAEQLSRIPKHIILIDDVVTTGTTANEICTLLKKHGVQKVTLLCLCIALPN